MMGGATVTDHDYEAGKRDGKIEALEDLMSQHSNRLDIHERRLAMQEKITYGLIGAIALANFLPDIKRLFIG